MKNIILQHKSQRGMVGVLNIHFLIQNTQSGPIAQIGNIAQMGNLCLIRQHELWKVIQQP